MSKEHLDAVKDQLLSDDNDELRQKVFSAYLEEPERGANMIIAFAKEKEIKLDATPSEVIDYINTIEDDDVEVEMTQEMLANVAGGMGLKGIHAAATTVDTVLQIGEAQKNIAYIDQNGAAVYHSDIRDCETGKTCKVEKKWGMWGNKKF